MYPSFSSSYSSVDSTQNFGVSSNLNAFPPQGHLLAVNSNMLHTGSERVRRSGSPLSLTMSRFSIPVTTSTSGSIATSGTDRQPSGVGHVSFRPSQEPMRPSRALQRSSNDRSAYCLHYRPSPPPMYRLCMQQNPPPPYLSRPGSMEVSVQSGAPVQQRNEPAARDSGSNL